MGEAVVYALSMMGVECSLVKQDGTDIIACKSIDDSLLVPQRIEVKTITWLNEKKLFNFSTSKGGDKRAIQKKIRHHSFVFHQTKRCLFFNVEKLQKGK